MARRRMFNLDIIDTDLFIEMPQSSRLLYYELCMRADDDGFVSSPKKIQRVVGCSDDDFKVLITKKFIIPFETGVVVIRHWKIHNYIQKDRYKETIYVDEKRQLDEEKNGMYTRCIQDGYTGKVRIELGKYRDNIYGEFKNVKLSDDEYAKLEKSNLLPYIDKLSSYIASKGKRYKSHYATILNWARKDKPKEQLPEWFNQDIKKQKNENEEELKNMLKEFE